jgi:energy-coupling factor transport system substrate-specific component
MKKQGAGLVHLEELIIFALFGAMMFLSAQIDVIPNCHPLAMFIIVLTVIYRVKALVPIYLYVFLEGLLGGFSLWWIPYLYVWTVLWAITMLIPKKIPESVAAVIICIIAGLHGIAFGVLYAPFQCYVIYDGDWAMTLTWLIHGALFDTVHCVSNVTASILAVPMIRIICKLSKRNYPFKKAVR